MSTQAVDLYVWGPSGDPSSPGRLVLGPGSSLPPRLPAIVPGDTWAIKLYYVGGNAPPFFIARYEGAHTTVQLRAAGNNIIYATANELSEFSPVAAPNLSRIQAAADYAVEKQQITYDSNNGSFKLQFFLSTATRFTPPPYDAGSQFFYCIGTTQNIPCGGTAQQIEDAINSSIQFYKIQITSLARRDSFFTVGGPWSGLDANVPLSARIKVTGWTQGRGFTLEFGSLVPYTGGLFTSRHLLPVALCGFDPSGIQVTYGWNVTLPLDGNGHTFSDLLLATNKPAYLEVLLQKVGEGQQIAAQTLLPSADDLPAITNGPPPAGTQNLDYAFVYTATGLPSFSLLSGALPPGLTLDASGQLLGVPVSPGTFAGVVRAANAVGHVDQAFSIVIAAGQVGGGGPPPATAPTGNYYDGNYALVESSDIPYYESMDDEWPGLIVWHQPLELTVAAATSSKPSVGDSSPFGYFWKETPYHSLGSGLVRFERLWHNIPGVANRPIGIAKDYQVGDYTFTNGTLTDVAIISFSRAIKANCNYHYGLNDPGGLPVKPFIQIIPFLHGQLITDLGTGFPYRVFNGVNLPDNNFGSSFITGSVEHVIGRLYCRKTISG